MDHTTDKWRLFSGADAAREEILEHFEAAWAEGKDPNISEFAPAIESAHRIQVLIDLVLIDLEWRLKAGEAIRIETYLERFPELIAEKRVVVELLKAEYRLRLLRHEEICPDEYDRRFPEYTTELRDRLQISTASSVHFSNETQAFTPLRKDHQPSPEMPRHAGRFVIEEEIARGGMGAILRAHDTDINRTVAVKVMLGQSSDRPDLHNRFYEEAQITGQLQHPGIPPIYELGQLEDGRPYFAMKLIEGRTLAEILKDRELANGNQSPEQRSANNLNSQNPAADARLIQIFEQICQTVGYAHSQGVIHRDLKPANIMVGAFGEVQVMDWGLAKQLGKGEPRFGIKGPHIDSPSVKITESSESLDTRKASRDSRTEAGSVLGTPAFMAPEQARGEIDLLDERCDVFGLGAILCVILTGVPPFRGPSVSEVMKLSAAGQLDETLERLERCGADDQLTQLARNCLAPEKERRMRDAAEAAQAIHEFQTAVQSRLRKAELNRAAADAKAVEERRRRRITVTLGAALCAAISVALIAATWLWFNAEENAAEAWRQRQDALRNQSLAEASAERASQARKEAETSQLRAESSFRAARKSFERIKSLQDHPRLQAGELEILKRSLQKAEAGFYQQFVKLRGEAKDFREETATAFYRLAYLTSVLGSKQEALAHYRDALDFFNRLHEQFPDALIYQEQSASVCNDLAAVQAELGKQEAARASYQKAKTQFRQLVAQFPKVARYQFKLGNVVNNLGSLEQFANPAKARKLFRTAILHHEKAVTLQPHFIPFKEALARSYNNFGQQQLTDGNHQTAMQWLEKTQRLLAPLELQRTAEEQWKEIIATNWHLLGEANTYAGQFQTAEIQLEKARSLFEQLREAYPERQKLISRLASSYRFLATVQKKKGHVDQALAGYRKALALREDLKLAFPAEVNHRIQAAIIHNDIGDVYRTMGETKKAEDLYLKARARFEALAKEFPKQLVQLDSVAATHNRLFLLYLSQRRFDEAETAAEKAKQFFEILVQEQPDILNSHQSLASVYHNLALLNDRRGRRTEALQWAKQAKTIQEKLIAANPDNREIQAALANTYNSVGLRYLGSKKPKLAEGFLEKALALQDKVVQHNPSITARTLQAGILVNLGGFHTSAKPSLSLQWLDRAVAILESVRKRVPKDATAKEFLCNALRHRGRIRMHVDRRAEALKDLELLVKIEPKVPPIVYLHRSICLAATGDHVAAIAEANRLLKFRPLPAVIVYDLGCVYSLSSAAVSKDATLGRSERARRKDEYGRRAVELLTKAFDLGFRDVGQYKRDRDLDPVRKRAEFKMFFAEAQMSKKK